MNTKELGLSLVAAFARVHDVRSRHGRRFPLPALLTFATAAMLAGARNLYAIVQWGTLQPVEVQRALDFTRGRLPASATLHYASRQFDVPAFEAVLREWAAQAFGGAERHVVLDGKALRGIHGGELPGVRLVAVYATEADLAQAGDQGRSGADMNARGAGAGQAGSRVEHRPAVVGTGTPGGTIGERGCDLLPAGVVPPGAAGGHSCSPSRKTNRRCSMTSPCSSAIRLPANGS